MSQESVRRYSVMQWIVRVLGILFLLAGLCSVLYILLAPWFPFQAGYVQSAQPGIVTQNIADLLSAILWRGIPGILIALGLVCYASSFRRATATYWCIQAALWLVGISLWFHFNSNFSPWPANPTWLVITIVCSLLLLIFRKRIRHVLA